MKLSVSLSFAALFLAATSSVSASKVKGANSYRVQPQRLRKLKSAAGGSVANDGLIEIKPCVNFDQVTSDQLSNSQTDATCTTNTCNGGCCRDYVPLALVRYYQCLPLRPLHVQRLDPESPQLYCLYSSSI